MSQDYRARVIDSELESSLGALGAVVLEGARACGKTATALQHSKSSVRLDVDSDARAIAQIDPNSLLDGEPPRLIDEWQLEPQLWNHVRQAVDDRQTPGQFILTGSAVPSDDVTRHSGAGRIIRLRMRPMSLYESGHSTGGVSLSDVLDGNAPRGVVDHLPIAALLERLCIGGWPGLQMLTADEAQQALRSYLRDVARIDIPRFDVRRDPSRVRRLLRSLARNVATQVSAARLAADSGEGGEPLGADSVREYLSTLERLMIVEDQGSWAPHLRSRDAVRKAAKRHFVDPSLAVAAMNASPEKLLRDTNTLGYLFESLAIRDLRVYTQSLDGEVLHYRDSEGVEVDAIVSLQDGRWAGFEVKLGESRVEDGADSLRRFARKVDFGKVGEPAVLGVITAGRYSYMREDGIAVIPIGLLGP